MSNWKPAKYPSLSPYMVATDALRLISFMEKAFGGKVERRFDMPDGTVMHAEVRIGDGIVMLGQAGGEWKPVSNWMHLYVKDVDSTYLQALKAGAVSVQEPKQRKGDSDKRGGVCDPDGNTWWIATQLS
jgi:PhnB protein